MTGFLNTPFDLDSELVVDTIDELPLWSAPFGMKLLEHIRLRKNIRVLDIGFGTGFPFLELAMRLGNSSEIIGIDPWQGGIKRTKKKLKTYGIQNTKIIAGVAEDIPLENSSVDIIISNNGMNNVSDHTKAVTECARVLKSGGQFIQTLNLNKTFIEFYDILKDVLNDNKASESILKIDKHIYSKRKPLDEVINVQKSVGFEIIETQSDLFNYHFVDGKALFNHYFIQLAFLKEWKGCIPEDSVDIVFGDVESRINKIANKEGQFTMSVPFVLIDSVKK
jgi:ubiquinone/menaquinone biosynthesis C-methylase UbiE